MRWCGRDSPSRQLSRQTVGTRDPHAGDSGNPDSNPDKVSGYGPAASSWRRIPPSLAWLESLGWRVTHGLDIAPGEPGAERADYAQVVLEARLRDALARLNPALPSEALEDAFRRLTRPRRRRVGGAQSRAAGRRVVGSLRFG